MLQEFKKHIDTHFPYVKEGKVLIAISSGIDSVVLTHLAKKSELDFSLCHCNFKLRGEESDDDERFVKELAKKLSVKIYSTSFDTENYATENKLSIQVAARDLRYQWFYQLVDKHSYDYVLTAHNCNDNLETFIIHLTRGTGLEGFTGIPVINDKTIRPLLKFSREEITMFAIKNEISWREDRSNANIKYVRNKVRHKIIPILKEINPHVLESFQKTLIHLNESQSIINDKIEEVSKEIVTKEKDLIRISISKLKKLNNQKAYLYQLLNTYGFTEWNDVADLLNAQSGKQVFSKTHRLLKDRNDIILTSIREDLLENKTFKITKDQQFIQNPIRLSIQETTDSEVDDSNTIIVDKELLKFPLQVRKWSYGDYICPTGMKGSKKLSQLFKDRKLSLIDKENIWLLTDADDHIIWVIGMRQDRRFTVSNTTQNQLKISHLS